MWLMYQSILEGNDVRHIKQKSAQINSESLPLQCKSITFFLLKETSTLQKHYLRLKCYILFIMLMFT